ncbi:hypothetical protein HW555_011105 [Spodoptera exigua]|uniref:lysozyme n=1 Tax=Spodoptera exigua TaxID=7107 RepID=A0A835G9Z6_SPOEX|nr:hypothetical protein HW555_011105 [Spodoptera exigua]
MTRAILFIVALCFIAKSNGKTFTECELVHELRRQGFPEHQLKDCKVCLIEAESSKRTHVVGGSNSDGSHDYGLFQINNRYWCNDGDHPGKGCNIRSTMTSPTLLTGAVRRVIANREDAADFSEKPDPLTRLSAILHSMPNSIVQ